MSDNEGATKKSGYRLEYASSARAKCKGAKPCSGTPIAKGTLRIGTVVDIRGNTNFAWRHWGCTTPKIISNIKAKFSDPDDLDGFDELNDEDKARIRRAWQEGHVADEDIPPTARKPAEAEGEDKSKKKRAPPKKKADAEGDEEEKPKKKRATKPKKVDEDGEDEADDVEEKPKAKKSRAKKAETEEDGEKPKASRRQPAAQKAAPKKKAPKDDEDISGEDFADEMAELDDYEDEEPEESAGKKRKRPAPTKSAAPAKKSKATSSRAKKSKPVVEEDEDDE